MSDALEKARPDVLNPVVQSSADPGADLLLQLRAIIQHMDDLKDLFIRFRKESRSVEWLKDMLAARLVVHVIGEYSFDDVVQGCLYLVDEYNQLGEGYFIVSTETGRVVSVLTEDDLYDPEMQARHSGDVAQPLKRIKPDLETMMVTYHHEKARSETILATLAEKGHQTALLKEEGDPRLRMATRGGRKAIAEDLAGDDPWELLGRASGTSGMFLRHFPLTRDVPEGFRCLEGVASFRSTIKVQDPSTLNISYNRLGTLRSAAPQGWVRDIARTLSEMAYKDLRVMPVEFEDLTFSDLDGVELWVAEPDLYKAFLSIHPAVRAVPIEGIDPVGLTGQVGYLTVSDGFEVESRERFQRWEITASLQYKLYVPPDWESVRVLPILGVPREAVIEN